MRGCISIGIFLLLLSASALAESGHDFQSIIIPTKYRFLLLDMDGSLEQDIVKGEPTLNTDRTANQESEFQAEDLEAMLPDNTATPLYSGMGRGYVETNFAVSLDEPGRKVDNRERLTARGLFDVHVIHEFS